nr:lysophospholipid acyltransferase family protein [Inmirania thermothiophila]
MQLLRSALFQLFMVVTVLLWAPAVVLLAPAPYRWRYAVARSWARINIAAAARLCGIRYRVRGAEHLPPGPAIVFSKHQSAWETLALVVLLPPQTWVLKRELLWIPVFGWALALLRPVAIDRSAGRRAVEAIVRRGRERLRQGLWIVVYPEGTRVAPGTRRRYGIGGAVLAERTGAPVVPVAHNAGLFWPRRALLRRPGTVEVVIGPVIETRGLAAAEINARAERWIETESARLLPPELAARVEALPAGRRG